MAKKKNLRTMAQQRNFAKMRLASVPSAIENAYPYLTNKQLTIATKVVKFINLVLKRWA